MRATVAGSSGFVGRALVKFLRERGYGVREVTRKCGDDLCDIGVASSACQHADIVFNLAAKVGGIGFIEGNDADCMLSSLINTNLLRCCESRQVTQYFFASSSCVYPGGPRPMKESDALPTNPHTGYGWEKIFSERMCQAFDKDKNIRCTIARFHTLYGPGDHRPAGREHVIESLCKKVAVAKLTGNHEIEIWGDGNQTRSFLYIDDCIEGIWRMVTEPVKGPLNLANPNSASVNELVGMLEYIAGVQLVRQYNMSAPTGIIHKTSDNAALRAALNWEPPTTLWYGLEQTYRDTFDHLTKNEIWQTSSIQTR